MKTVFLDIETITNPNLSPEMYDILVSNIKIGNVKQEHLIAEKQQEAIAKFGLDPMAGVICCVGTAIDDGPVTVGIGPDENAHLTQVVEAMGGPEPPRLVTFSGSKFDTQYLFIRALALSHEPAGFWKHFHGRYLIRYGSLEVDLRTVLTGGDKYKSGKLEHWCRVMGIPVPFSQFNGSDVQPAWESGDYQSIANHCRNDVNLLQQLYQKMEGYMI